MFGLIVSLLATTNAPGARVPISDVAADGACTTFATLLSSEVLFGPRHDNSSNYSAALSFGLQHLASGKVKKISCATFPSSGAKLLILLHWIFILRLCIALCSCLLLSCA